MSLLITIIDNIINHTKIGIFHVGEGWQMRQFLDYTSHVLRIAGILTLFVCCI